MDIITDHNILFKKFSDIQNELVEAEHTYHTLHHRGRREDSNFSERYDRDRSSVSFRYISHKEVANKRPKLNESSDSPEESVCEDEHPTKKAALQSAVIVRVRNDESRKDLICKQNVNKKVKSRNRRILGMLQSTLQKFQDEAVKRQPQELKKIMVEQKVEAAKEEEIQRMKREEAELYIKIKEKKLLLDYLEQMMKITEPFETWKCNKKKLLNFIITKTKPRIFFLPASHNQSSNKRLEKSRIEIQENIREQEEAMKKELAKIKESYDATHSIIEESIKMDSSSSTLRERSTFQTTEGKKYEERNQTLLEDDNVSFSN